MYSRQLLKFEMFWWIVGNLFINNIEDCSFYWVYIFLNITEYCSFGWGYKFIKTTKIVTSVGVIDKHCPKGHQGPLGSSLEFFGGLLEIYL